MADFFKSAAQAGMEVRRRGQLSPDDDRDPWLTELGKVASEGMQTVQPIAPRRGIAAPKPDSADLILQNYLSGESQPDPADAIIQNYLGSAPAEQPQAAPQSEGTLAGDIGRSVVRGGIALGGGAYELANLATQGGLDTATKKVFGTSGTEAISGARESLNKQDSPELQRQRAELEKADGFWNSMGTVLSNPRLLGSMAVEMVPQMATVVGAAKTVATRTLASQIAQGATKEAAEKAAQRAATMTVMGVNPALEAGMAAQDVRSSIMQMSEKDLQASPQYQALLSQGVSAEDARGRLANDAANFAAIVAAPISLASNTLTAGFEARLATGQVGKQFGLKRLGKEVGEGIIKEPIQEGIEEGGSQLGQNVGIQQAVNPEQSLLAGVPEAAGAGAALGVVAGAGFGSANARFGLTKDPNAQGSATPPSGAGEGTAGSGSGPGTRPGNLELTDNQFTASLNSPRIVPFLTALWANSDEMTQSRIQELARRNNLMVDFAEQANDPEILQRGTELIRQSGDQFVNSFINTMNRDLAKQDVTPLPPKTPEKTPEQLQAEFDENQGFDVADNAIASAEALGIQPNTKKGNDRTQKGNVPGRDVLLRGYQRRAENLMGQPLAARRAAATSSITEMIGRGFTAEEAEAVFGPLREDAPAPQETVRVYHSGSRGEGDFGRWVSTNKQYASDYRSDLPLFYIDIPKDDPRLKGAWEDQGVDQGFTFNFELTPEEAAKLQPIERDKGATVAAPEPQASATDAVPVPPAVQNVETTPSTPAAVVEPPAVETPAAPVEPPPVVNEQPAATETLAAPQGERISNVPMYYSMKNAALRDDLKSKYPKGTTTLKLIQDGIRTSTTRRQFANVGDIVTFAGDGKEYRVTDVRKPDLSTAEGRAAWESAEGWSLNFIDADPKLKAQVYSPNAVQTIFEPVEKAATPQRPVEQATQEAPVQEEPVVQETPVVTEPVTNVTKKVTKATPQQASVAPATETVTNATETTPEKKALTIEDFGRAETERKAKQAPVPEPVVETLPADKPSTTRQITPSAPDIMVGTFGAEKNTPSESASRQESMRNEAMRNILMRQAARKGMTFEQFVAELRKDQQKIRIPGAKGTTRRISVFKGIKPGEVRDQYEKIKANLKPIPEAKAPQPIPRQGKLGEGDVKKKASTYLRRANDVMFSLVKKLDVSDRIEALSKAIERLEEKRPLARSESEYIFTILGETGGLSQEDTDALNSEKARRAAIEALRNKIEDVQANNLKARADALRGQMDVVEQAFDNLRAEMERDGIPQNIIDDILLEKEIGVRNIRSGSDNSITPEQEFALRSLLKGLSFAETEVKSDNPLDKQVTIDNIVENAKKAADPEQYVRSQLASFGFDEDVIDRVTSLFESVDQDSMVSEPASETGELFGETSKVAAQVVDALSKEVDGYRALAVLKAEAGAANVGNLDIFNEMRLRGMEIPENLISFANRPGVRYSLDFWLKKNDGRNPYTVRDEWFGSLDQTLRDLDGRQADKDEILNGLSAEESKLFKDWQKQRADLRNRIAERVKSDGINEYQFNNLEDAFPHALFNKYPLSSMFDPTKIPDADRPALLALAGGNADSLPSLWYSDVNAVLTARGDLEGQVQETLSEDEYAKYQEWRNRQTRIELSRAKAISQSPAFSQLFQLQSLLDPETYESVRAQISVAQQNQLPAILQSAYELAEQQRAATKQNVDEATDAVMDAVYAQDETHLSAVDADAVPDTDTELNQNNEQMTDEGAEPDKILDQLRDVRFKRGRYSGVTIAADVFAHLNKITSGWNRAPQYQVLNSINQLPEDLRELALSKLGTQGAKGMTGPDGQIYIFSDFIENLEDAEFVFFHEIYGHFGLRGFLGDKLNAFLENQYKTNQRVRAEANRLMAEAKESGRGISKLEATEEAIADLAVGNQEPGLFVQIMQALKKFFRSIGMDSVARWMDTQSHKDLAFVLSQVRKAVREGNISPMNGAPEEVRFVANQNPVEIFVTKNGKTNVYGMYNALTGNWTVFYNPNGLEANNYGIQTFDGYADALAYARQYGKVISAKDHPRRQAMGPGDFNKVSIKPPSDVTGWKAYVRRSNITFVKKLLPILEVVEQIKAQGGETNLWQAITLYRGRIKPYFDQFRREFVRPIAAALDKIKSNGDTYKFDGVEYAGQDLVDLYLLALHAQERNETIQNIRPDKKDGSGLKTEEANKILQDLAKTKSINELASIAKLTQRLSKMKVNYMLQTSLINEAQASALGQYLFYVNLSGSKTDSNETVDRAMLGGRSINLRGNDVKRALGRESLPVDVLENTLNNYLGVVLRGQKNIVALSVYDMVTKNPNPSFAIVNPFAFIKKLDIDKLIADKNILRVMGEQPTYESGQVYVRELRARVESGEINAAQAASEMYRKLEDAYQQGKLSGNQFAAYSQKIENASFRHANILSPEGYVTDVQDVDRMNRENVFVVKVKGKPVAIEFMEGVDDREAGKIGTFASALHGGNNKASSAFSEAVGAANRWIGQLITSKNLAWVPVNWMRDIGTAYFNAAADPRVGKELAAKMFQRAPQSYAVAFKNLIADDYGDEKGPVYSFLKKMASKPVDADTQRMWGEFVNSGAQVFFMDRKDMKEQINEMQRELNPRGGLLGTWDAYGRFADFIGIPAEASARFATYRTLREAGWTIEDAAVYAKEITVNFEQTGSWRAIRNYFMFANPAIQGNVRMFRDLVTKNANGTYVPNAKFMKLIGALAGFGFVMGFVARAFGDNGEDEVNDLDKIPRYKRATSVVIVPGVPMGSPVPMPYGWNVFYALGNFSADSLFGKTPVSTSAGRMVSTAIDAFWPLGQSESGTILGTALKVFTPTLASPLVDIAMNESKFGGPIAKGDNPFVKSEEANAYMNFNSASPISVWMARSLNEIAGGNQYRSGGLGRNALDKPIIPLDINPAYIDYLFASYLPGPFTDVGRLANLSINVAIGKDVKNPPIPLIDRFGSRISEGWDAGAFRTASTFLETKVAEAKAAPKEKRDEITKEYPNLGPAKDALAGIDRDIRNMRSQLRAIEANPKISSREKVEARNKIQALEKEYYKRGVALAIRAGFQPQLLSGD